MEKGRQYHQLCTSTGCSIFKTYEKDPPWFMRPKKRNSNFKLLVTLPSNAEAGKRVSVTGSSHQIRPERTERATKSLFLELRNIS